MGGGLEGEEDVALVSRSHLGDRLSWLVEQVPRMEEEGIELRKRGEVGAVGSDEAAFLRAVGKGRGAFSKVPSFGVQQIPATPLCIFTRSVIVSFVGPDVDVLIEDAFKTAGSLSTVGIETQRRKHLAYLMADHGTLINPESSQNLPKHKLHRR